MFKLFELRLGSIRFNRNARDVPPEQYTSSHIEHGKGFLQHMWPPQLSQCPWMNCPFCLSRLKPDHRLTPRRVTSRFHWWYIILLQVLSKLPLWFWLPKQWTQGTTMHSGWEQTLCRMKISCPGLRSNISFFILIFSLLSALIFIFLPAVLVGLDVCEIIFQPVWGAVNVG